MFSKKQVDKVITALKKEVETTLENMFPVSGTRRTLKLEKIKFGSTTGLMDLKRQRDIKLKDRSLTIPVRGHFTLWDNETGEKIDDKTVRLISLPILTNRFTYIVDGNEYQSTNQLRLKAGAYTRIANNGQIETQINIGNKPGFKLIIDPQTELIQIKAGTSHINLYAFLKGMGITDSYMQRYLGEEVLDKNRSSKNHRVNAEVKKFAQKVLYSESKNIEDIRKEIKEYFDTAEMNPDTTEITLGKRFEKVNVDLILEAAKKLISVAAGKSDEDDRDSLVFKKFMGIEDHLSERIRKSSQSIQRSVENNIDRHTEIKQMVSPDMFNDKIKSFFTTSDLVSAPEITNPLSALGNYNKVTIMGEGGIQDSNQLSNEMININPSTLGFLDPVHTPESQKIGANLHLSALTGRKGQDLTTKVIDLKTGKVKEVTPKEISQSVVAFPDQYDKKNKKFKSKNIKVMNKTKMDELPESKIDYVLLSSKGIFDVTTNLIPFLQNTQGNRAMMGGKMQEQALSLKEREAPLVQSATEEGKNSFEEILGHNNAEYAPISGTVISTKPFKIKSDSGKIVPVELYDHFPLSGDSMVNHDIKVKKGDRVEKGQLIADSNFTDNGTMALGKNMTVAYMPYKGLTFEDGLVVSETAAKKFTSEHLYTKELNNDKHHMIDKRKFQTLYPREITAENMKKLDEKGIIKKGQKVKDGDVLIAALKKKETTDTDALLKNIHKKLAINLTNAAVYWRNQNEGVVQDIIKNGNKIKVLIETEEKAKEGDKIVGRYGNKGTISKIIPDNEMPKTEEGKQVEVILNPATIPSRQNPSQVLETAAAKIAEKTGKPYIINNFNGENFLDKIKKDMKKYNVKEKEIIIDPNEGELENPVFVGKQYFLKLHHQAKEGFSARSVGGRYDLNEQPARGGKDSAQAFDVLTNYALLAHGAKNNLREMSSLKGTENDEYWRAFQFGQPLPKPSTPFVFDKFIEHLKALGVNVEKNDEHFQLMAMTDKDIEKMSNGEIEDATIVKAKNLQEEKGGLFDPEITGGKDGKESKWSHINLIEPVPNPIYEDAILSLLGNDKPMTGKQYQKILNGEEKLNGKTGGEAIRDALAKIDINQTLEQTREAAEQTKNLKKKDKLYKKIRYLEALKKTDRKPEHYVLTKMPILPPRFRPLYELPDGNIGTSDVNELYKHMILVNKALKQDKELGLLSENEIGEMRNELYNSMKAVQGIADPITADAKNRNRRGILVEIGGTKGIQPKNAFFQNKVLRKRVDLSGRGTIVAGPELDVDTVGLPKEMAWEIFKPHIMRKMILEKSFSPKRVRTLVESRSKEASKVLREVMEETPVILNRAPSLHKFSTMAFKGKLVDGKSIRLPSLVCSGFNADFDGDHMSVHVPVSKEAKKEAWEKLTPSNNLFKPGHGDFMYMPGHEQILGLYYLTKNPEKNAKIKGNFSTNEEAIREYRKARRERKKWSKEDPIKVNGKRVTIGKIMVNDVLPKNWKRYDKPIDKNYLKQMFSTLGEQKFDNKKMVEIANKLKDLGNDHVYKRGFTLGLSDLDIKGDKEKQKIYDEAKKKVDNIKRKPGSKQNKLKQIHKIFADAEKKALDTITQKNKDNAFIVMQQSGARGNQDNVRSILAGPGLLTDNKGEIVPIPVTKSYSEGVDSADYWTAMYGARKGMIDRAKSTSEPGRFTKQLINNTLDHLITENDCGTHQGKVHAVDSKEIKNRFLAEDVRTNGGNVVAKRNELLNSEKIKELKKLKVKNVKVRTPLKCEAEEGLCAYCYGAFKDGSIPSKGTNIGIIAGHALTEPSTQMTMDSFHSGGVASHEVSKAEGLERLDQIFQMPQTIKNEATLAEKDGKVEKIEEITTGKNIYISGKKHFVPKRLNLKVRKGDMVRKGDPISDGVIKPQTLHALKGLDSVREHMTEELYETYGQRINKPTLETVVQKVTNLTKIKDPGNSDFLEGQYAPLNKVEALNKREKLSVSLSKAVGETLTAPAGGYPAGTILTQNIVDNLKRQNVKRVEVKARKINHMPELKGINQLPLTSDDWIGKMNFTNIPGQFREAASFAYKSKYKNTNNPIPAFAHGVDFGKSKDKY